MNAISLLRNQMKAANDLLEATMADVTLEQAHWILNYFLVGHPHNMTGKISCLKGLQGAKGYPV